METPTIKRNEREIDLVGAKEHKEEFNIQHPKNGIINPVSADYIPVYFPGAAY